MKDLFRNLVLLLLAMTLTVGSSIWFGSRFAIKEPMRSLGTASLQARSHFSIDLDRAYAERCLKR